MTTQQEEDDRTTQVEDPIVTIDEEEYVYVAIGDIIDNHTKDYAGKEANSAELLESNNNNVTHSSSFFLNKCSNFQKTLLLSIVNHWYWPL